MLRSITAMTWPSRVTGIDSRRTGTPRVHSGSPSRQIRRSRWADSRNGRAPVGAKRAHHVVVERGRPGRRAHLGQHHPAGAVLQRRPQHQVGEGQVGQQLPVGHQGVQPVDVGRRQRGVAAGEVVQRGHPAIIAYPRTGRAWPEPRSARPAAHRSGSSWQYSCMSGYSARPGCLRAGRGTVDSVHDAASCPERSLLRKEDDRDRVPCHPRRPRARPDPAAPPIPPAPAPQVLRGQAAAARADPGHGAGQPGPAGARARPALRHVADHRPPGPGRAGGRGPAAAHAGQGHVRGQAQGRPAARTGQLHPGDAGARAAPADQDPGYQLRARPTRSCPSCWPSRRAAGCCASTGSGWPTASPCPPTPRTCPPAGSPGCAATWTGTPRCTRRWPSAYGVQLTEAEETIETVLADPTDARLLGVDAGMPLLLLSRQAFDVSAESRSSGPSPSTAATATSWSPGCAGPLTSPRRPVSHQAAGSRPAASAALMASPATNGVKPSDDRGRGTQVQVERQPGHAERVDDDLAGDHGRHRPQHRAVRAALGQVAAEDRGGDEAEHVAERGAHVAAGVIRRTRAPRPARPPRTAAAPPRPAASPAPCPASSTPRVCPVMGTGVKDRWIEIWASSPTKPAAPTTRSASRTSAPGSRSASTSGERWRSAAASDMRRTPQAGERSW